MNLGTLATCCRQDEGRRRSRSGKVRREPRRRPSHHEPLLISGGITKSETYQKLAEATGLSRKQVAAVFEVMAKVVGNDLGKEGPGILALPGLAKLKVVRKPATPARMGINPFTKQEQMFKAKPVRNVVNAVPFKALKDMGK
jgi:nucleoid DNA-binding protein